MSWKTKLPIWTAVAATAIALNFGGVATPALAEEVVLHMAVPDWPPTRIMKDLFDKNYKSPSGNDVKLDIDFIPWPDYYTRLNTSLTSGENKYNMAVSDSQWLGAFIEAGYYRKINDLIDADPGLKATLADMHPNPLQAYATYPYKSENYYGFPQMPDILINYYRTDIVCNEDEQKNFQAKYNQKLPCTPEEMDDVDWDTFEKMGEFFMRKKGDMLAGKPADDDFYGIAYQAGKAYDMNTMQINGFIWQHGGNIWDETQAPTGHAEGVVNSPEAVKALDHYLRLTKYMPPVVKTGGMDALQDRRAIPRRQARDEHRVDWLRRKHDQPGDVEGGRQGRFRPDARPARRRRQARPLVEYRRSAFRDHDLDRRQADQRDCRLREMVALNRHAARLRRGRRPERHQVGLQRPEVSGLPPVEPDLGAGPRMAEGCLAHSGVLRAARAGPGAV